jgi:MSHA biogenesis protein MshK
MDDTVIARPARKALLALAMLAAAACAPAQPLQDPTRPPAPLLRALGANPAPLTVAPPQLQSVLIARHAGGRQVAIIDGQTLRLGQSYHGARLVRMTDTEVELVRGREHQILKLFPGAASKTVPASR